MFPAAKRHNKAIFITTSTHRFSQKFKLQIMMKLIFILLLLFKSRIALAGTGGSYDENFVIFLIIGSLIVVLAAFYTVRLIRFLVNYQKQQPHAEQEQNASIEELETGVHKSDNTTVVQSELLDNEGDTSSNL